MSILPTLVQFGCYNIFVLLVVFELFANGLFGYVFGLGGVATVVVVKLIVRSS